VFLVFLCWHLCCTIVSTLKLFGVKDMKNQEKKDINTGKKPIIRLENIHKSFGYNHVLRGVNLELYPDEIVAIVGDNGSGKSTLIKILSGSLQPDQGTIYIKDQPYSSLTPRKAIEAGITTVYQDLSLDNYRDVAGNIFLGQELTKGKFYLDYPRMRQASAEILKKLDINIPDPTVPVGHLSGGQRQGVAIARAVFQCTEGIIFDEPTAAMGVRETTKTLQLIKSLVTRGIWAIVVSHNLFQVFDIAHRVCIVRQGKIIENIATQDSTPQEIHQAIMSAAE
jgi:ABC-type sugar transport system ATPase subunit